MTRVSPNKKISPGPFVLSARMVNPDTSVAVGSVQTTVALDSPSSTENSMSAGQSSTTGGSVSTESMNKNE